MVAYLDKLLIGEIPHERMDRRILRLIWEHKKVMKESISKIETELCIDTVSSKKYDELIDIANEIRMLYALYHQKQRDSLIPIIQMKIMKLRDDEKAILDEFIDKVKEKCKNEIMEVH